MFCYVCRIWRQSNWTFAFYGRFFFFLLVCENKKMKKKNVSTFLKVYISGMACAMYFRSDMCSVMICWHLHIELGLVITKLCTYVKSYFFLHVTILTLCMHAHFLGPLNTVPSVHLATISNHCCIKEQLWWT